jgi:tetratricopeptide (TPR) repeat protein
LKKQKNTNILLNRLGNYFSYMMICVLALSFYSCGSGSTIKIASEPAGATIFVKSLGSKDGEKIGVTPFEIKDDQLAKKKLKDGPLVVELEKQGYANKTVILSEVEAVDIDVSVPLQAVDQLKEANQYDDISSKLFEVQRLTRTKNYSEALKLVKSVQKLNPEISVPYELEGGILYLQKNLKESYNAFDLAYSKNSSNTFALRMKKIIRAKLGGGKQ